MNRKLYRTLRLPGDTGRFWAGALLCAILITGVIYDERIADAQENPDGEYVCDDLAQTCLDAGLSVLGMCWQTEDAYELCSAGPAQNPNDPWDPFPFGTMAEWIMHHCGPEPSACDTYAHWQANCFALHCEWCPIDD